VERGHEKREEKHEEKHEGDGWLYSGRTGRGGVAGASGGHHLLVMVLARSWAGHGSASRLSATNKLRIMRTHFKNHGPTCPIPKCLPPDAKPTTWGTLHTWHTPNPRSRNQNTPETGSRPDNPDPGQPRRLTSREDVISFQPYHTAYQITAFFTKSQGPFSFMAKLSNRH
jgi:hypothetical protein